MQVDQTNDKDPASPAAEHLLFVYGTLKRNEPNYFLVTDPSKGKAVFEGVFRTVAKYPLVIASRYNIPYLLHCEGVGKHVVGEVYRVDDAMLAFMDEFEGNGTYYQRRRVAVLGARELTPWAYFLIDFREHLLRLPYLEDYSSKGEHGLEYVTRYRRTHHETHHRDVQN
ncbi:hypothetical protein CDAR_390173 [Caerostris darwini]|uniref:Gamma-glutamylcyclotransferase family protein n=1 Tax=Caerostris darwini TaxID=1538125 RepID=A0AAV4NYY9_9ARAC|nr:hypothetical protein CDAR_390173 [Caerostris darwini]